MVAISKISKFMLEIGTGICMIDFQIGGSGGMVSD